MKVKAGGVETNVPIRRSPRGAYSRECRALEEQLRSNGWQTTSRGFPKYFCWKDGKISLVVVGKMNKKQAFLAWWFERYGIPCFSWTRKGGFERFDAAKWKLERSE